jgi:hypothetical protein
MQSLQDAYQSNVDNLNNAQHEGSGHFSNKTDYLKQTVDTEILETSITASETLRRVTDLN